MYISWLCLVCFIVISLSVTDSCTSHSHLATVFSVCCVLCVLESCIFIMSNNVIVSYSCHTTQSYDQGKTIVYTFSYRMYFIGYVAHCLVGRLILQMIWSGAWQVDSLVFWLVIMSFMLKFFLYLVYFYFVIETYIIHYHYACIQIHFIVYKKLLGLHNSALHTSQL